LTSNKQKTNNKQENKGISARLRTLRAEYNLTQADVAKELGISQQTYSKYESQDTNIDSATIKKICEMYGVSADYLLGIETGNTVAGKKELNSFVKSDDEIDFIVDRVLSKISEKK